MKPRIRNLQYTCDMRGYNAILYDAEIQSQLPEDFHIVQINQGFSIHKHTLRGLHYQLPPHAQAKLCYCLTGSVFNVAFNLETGEAVGEVLKPGIAMFIPRGYAHGYLTLEDNTLFQWCVDNDFAPDAARILHYKDVKPRIIAEPLLHNSDGHMLEEYNFFCFNGEPQFFMHCYGDRDKGETRYNDYFMVSGERIPIEWGYDSSPSGGFEPFAA